MENKILVETSARHVHLTQEHVEILFGKGYQLTIKKELSQPGQFACNEKVEVVGPKKSIANVSVLGPTRKDTQVEISLTDARTLGINAPVRESGDVKGSAPCKLVGPAGEIELTEGVIAAKRHLHFTPEDAASLGLADKQIVMVKVNGNGGRALIFDDVVVRCNSLKGASMHIDTDESNAACASGEVYGEIIK